eukprot:symbB.v1.2.008710.t1/scaffold547.1/size188680/2
MFKENTEEGKWHCSLAIRSLCAVEAEGSNQAESLKVAWGNCIKQKHRINLQERLWIQELFSELPCVPQDFYFEIVGLGHRRNETVVFVVATLLFPSENSFRGNPCEHWTNAIRSSIAVARKSLASQQLQEWNSINVFIEPRLTANHGDSHFIDSAATPRPTRLIPDRRVPKRIRPRPQWVCAGASSEQRPCHHVFVRRHPKRASLRRRSMYG